MYTIASLIPFKAVLALHLIGRLSFKLRIIYNKLLVASNKANKAGTMYHVSFLLSFEAHAKNAPIIGPIINAIEKAIPTRAIAFPLFSRDVTSDIMAIDILIFPLLIPPTNLASTNMPKFLENAHNKYDRVIPIKHKSIKGFLP